MLPKKGISANAPGLEYNKEGSGGVPLRPRTITLDVGGSLFKTLESTVTRHPSILATTIFEELDSRYPYNTTDPIFLDGDPDLFPHIVRYLRCMTFPLFWSVSDGFNYELYAALLGEARRWGIKPLVDWIIEEKYLKAVNVRHRTVLKDEKAATSCVQLHNLPSDPHIERTYFPLWSTNQPSQAMRSLRGCPRKIKEHEEGTSKCGKQCDKDKARVTDAFQETAMETLKTMVVAKITNIDYSVCSADQAQ